MEKNVQLIKTGWRIPIKLKEDFTDFCAKMGTVAEQDCSGALLLWQYLPAQIRERAKLAAKNQAPADKNFWSGFLVALEATIQGMNKSQKETRNRKAPKAG